MRTLVIGKYSWEGRSSEADQIHARANWRLVFAGNGMQAKLTNGKGTLDPGFL